VGAGRKKPDKRYKGRRTNGTKGGGNEEGKRREKQPQLGGQMTANEKRKMRNIGERK
jgi:hypothetical protein